MKIKAIETRYDNYRFRSRLEARWAVFFNKLRIKYEYEVEGFELPSGKYLPDFWLPELGTWVEIKGALPSLKEWDLIQELCVESKKDCLMAVGLPGNREDFDVTDGYRFPALFYLNDAGSIGCQTDCQFVFDLKKMGYVIRSTIYTEAIPRAIEAAKSARFEHGETPE